MTTSSLKYARNEQNEMFLSSRWLRRAGACARPATRPGSTWSRATGPYSSAPARLPAVPALTGNARVSLAAFPSCRRRQGLLTIKLPSYEVVGGDPSPGFKITL